ncbi:hypothetical protein [Ottowia thiooxydans]|uniref:hypothetical protein n=1 Tax=Ottowia thiooxydans TaxID=219182 RepID=UPI00042417E3|nr:hypothetical protein [Ottowia thiooxydans]
MKKLNPSEDKIFEKFKRHSKFYESSAKMGAGKILNNSLRLPFDTPTPLSLSHGVDFGHCFEPLDVNYIEPIHWAYNKNIHREASKIKPSICLPHPWLLLCDNREAAAGERALVISPPPGKENDRLLLEKVRKNHDLRNVDILLKHRGDIEGSIDFFQNNGVGIVSAGEGDAEFYGRLLNLLSKYEKIITCNFSSAIIFASSLGKPIEFIEDYSYEYYDVENIYKFVNYESKIARGFILNFIEASDKTRTTLSKNILGSDFFDDSGIMQKSYFSALESIDFPFHHKKNIQPIRRFIMDLGVNSSRRGVVRLGSGLNQFSRSKKRVMRIRVDELSVWKNGPSAKNLTFELEKFIPGVTIPATAVSKYEKPLK